MKLSKHVWILPILFLVFGLCPLVRGQSIGTPEDIQIRVIDLPTQVLELHNFGEMGWALDGWRLDSADEGVSGLTSPTGFDGYSLAPGESIFIHWNNDAAGIRAVNISALGGTAIADLDANQEDAAISIALFRDENVSAVESLVDYVQFSHSGFDIANAAPQAALAVDANLWFSESQWIPTTEETSSLRLVDEPFPGPADVHGEASYEASDQETLPVRVRKLNVTNGTLQSGSVKQFSISDDRDVQVVSGSLAESTPAEFEINGTSPFQALRGWSSF